MASPLNEKEVNRLYRLLTDNQKDYLEEYLKQSKKSKWLEKLAHKKGIVIRNDMTIDEVWDKLNDWELKEIFDGGYGNRPYRCECGMSLRFCYHVIHRKEQKTYHLGETCLGNYTLLSPDLIRDITKGLHKIDLERDDILKRYQAGWKLPNEFSELTLPIQYQDQIDIGLPLSALQIMKIENDFKEELRAKRQKLEMQRIFRVKERLNLSKVSVQRVPLREKEDSITYTELISKHIDHLKLIRVNEGKISNPSMKVKWEGIQDMVKCLKREGNFDYSKFLRQMFELLYYLKLY